MSRKLTTALSLVLLLTLGAKPAAPLHYLTPSSLDPISLLPPPPVKDSQESQDELALVLRAQSTRTPADIARAQSEDKLTVFAFADVLGPDFTPDHCPQTAALFADLDSDSKFFSKQAKNHFNRPRPPYADSRLHPLFTETDASYPSGHSTRAELFAELLATLLPAKRDALLARAQQIGYDRVLAGVHYPSDITAGRTLGHALATQLLTSPTFRPHLDALSAELSPTPQPTAAR